VDYNSFPQINWRESNKQLKELQFHTKGVIEEADSADHVDFANMYLGGGVLENGGLQEEIRFCISPECLVGMMFCSKMEDTECIIIKGAEKYSTVTGYAASLQYQGDYIDNTKRDSEGRKESTIIAIDALTFMRADKCIQFEEKPIMRELIKAYCGFNGSAQISPYCSVATGNWGCGAFQGDVQLKALIQLMAAAEANRNISYYSFGHPKCSKLPAFHNALIKNNVTVGDLLKSIIAIGYSPDLFTELTKRFKLSLETSEEVSLSSL
jgi:poly(ADP-ribose) glycohydrolase